MGNGNGDKVEHLVVISTHIIVEVQLHFSVTVYQAVFLLIARLNLALFDVIRRVHKQAGRG